INLYMCAVCCLCIIFISLSILFYNCFCIFFFFFFSSRRRHTRSLRDWSSDVCSSDLTKSLDKDILGSSDFVANNRISIADYFGRSEERRVGKSVDLGGRRIIKKKKKK